MPCCRRRGNETASSSGSFSRTARVSPRWTSARRRRGRRRWAARAPVKRFIGRVLEEGEDETTANARIRGQSIPPRVDGATSSSSLKRAPVGGKSDFLSFPLFSRERVDEVSGRES